MTGGWWPGCRIHGSACQVPWGYDRAHTDQDHPYTLEQLAARSSGPHFYAYPDHEAYVEGWSLWRALRRDAHPNGAERAAAFDVLLDRLDLPEQVKAEFRRAESNG